MQKKIEPNNYDNRLHDKIKSSSSSLIVREKVRRRFVNQNNRRREIERGQRTMKQNDTRNG